MTRIILTALAALSLSSCAALSNAAAQGAGLPESPVAVAGLTVRDEQALLGAELAYKAARIAAEIGVDAGMITGARATQFRDLNRRAYAALQIARTAYRAGNASSYWAAIAEARGIADQILTLTGRSN